MIRTYLILSSMVIQEFIIFSNFIIRMSQQIDKCRIARYVKKHRRRTTLAKLLSLVQGKRHYIIDANNYFLMGNVIEMIKLGYLKEVL